MAVTGRNRWVGVGVCALTAGMMLAGCEGGDNLPEPAGSRSLPTISRTAAGPSASSSSEVPSATTPPATTPSATTPSATTPPATTATATRTIVSRPPATTATATVTATPTEEPTSSSPSPTPTVSATPTSSEESTDTMWWWWLVVAAAIAAGSAWFLLAAARRRTWDDDFATKSLEARWAADTLMPSVTDRAAPVEEVAQRWRRGKPRLDELLTGLSRLAATASGAERSGRASRVSEAVKALSQVLDSDVLLRAGTSSTGQSGGELDESRRVAQTRADEVLVTLEGPEPSPGR
jgi:hypothetical protein